MFSVLDKSNPPPVVLKLQRVFDLVNLNTTVVNAVKRYLGEGGFIVFVGPRPFCGATTVMILFICSHVRPNAEAVENYSTDSFGSMKSHSGSPMTLGNAATALISPIYDRGHSETQVSVHPTSSLVLLTGG